MYFEIFNLNSRTLRTLTGLSLKDRILYQNTAYVGYRTDAAEFMPFK